MNLSFAQRLCRALVMLVGAQCATTVFAAPGDLDGTYGQHGRALFDVPGANLAGANNFFQQSDGKTVAVGFTRNDAASSSDFLVVRFNVDGSLDTTFGTGGYVRNDFGGSAFADSASAGVQQADGKLLIVGTHTLFSSGFPRRLAVMRLDANGMLDTSFDGDGKASPTIGTDAVGTDVHLQNDGSIVLAGWGTVSGGAADFVFARLLSANGALDSTYGSGGIAIVDFGGSEFLVRAIRQTDGKLVAVGSTSTAGVGTMIAARLHTNGTLDTGFNAAGTLSSSTCIGACQWRGVTQQPDGKLLFAGFTSLSASANAPGLVQEQSLIARYNVDGTIDTSFAINGQLTGFFALNTLAGERATSTVVDPVTGAITILGSTTVRSYNSTGGVVLGSSLIVGRSLATGLVDASFGQQGITTVPFTSPLHVFNDYGLGALTRLSDGRLLVSGLPGQYVNGSPVAQSVMIARTTATGGDPGVITVGIPSPVAETIGNAVVRLLRSGGTAGEVRVSYTTAPGSAAAGVDFTTTSGTVTWPDGDNAVKFVSVPIIADALVESSDENFSFVVSGATGGAEIDVATASATIARDDAPPASLLTLSQSAITVSEGAGTVAVTVARTGTGAVSVVYYSAAVSASLTNDFGKESGVLGWAVNDTSTRTITIPIVNDAINEAAETFNIMLTGAGGGAVFGSHAAVVTITDNDPLQVGFSSASASANESLSSITLNVVRTGATTQTMSVNYATANGTATAGSDYATAGGTLTWLPGDPDVKVVTIPLSSDALREGDETFAVTLSNVTGGATIGTGTSTVTVVDDDSPPQIAFTAAAATVDEAQSTVTLNLARTGPTALIHSVDYTTANGSAAASTDYTTTTNTVTWLPTDPDAKTITIALIPDAMREGDETFTVTLSNATFAATLGIATTTVTIVDNDPLPQLSFAASTASVNESQSSVTLSVTRTGATALAHAVNYATSDGTAIAGSDFTTTNGTLTWLPGDADTKTVTIPLTGDSTVESSETFTVALSNPTGGATMGTATATVTIVDDDTAPAPSSGSGGGGAFDVRWLAVLLTLIAARLAYRGRRKVRG